jgi:predicted transglutaminase-like cysteine proteinase
MARGQRGFASIYNNTDSKCRYSDSETFVSTAPPFTEDGQWHVCLNNGKMLSRRRDAADLATAFTGLKFTGGAETMNPVTPIVTMVTAALIAAAPLGEPFGVATRSLTGGPLVDTWRSLRAQLAHDAFLVRFCRDRSEICAPAAMLRSIVAEARVFRGRALLAHINRAINLKLQPMPSRWLSALDALRLGNGDCKAYAVAKYLALHEAGMDAVRLVMVYNKPLAAEHLVVAAYQDGGWVILRFQTRFGLGCWSSRASGPPVWYRSYQR